MSSTQKALLAGVAERFGLAEPPRRIEVYDNSHIMGTNAVGAMIVAGPEGFVKAQYRKFNIRSEDLTPGDDYGMMREVLARRFARLLREAGRARAIARADAETRRALARPRADRRRPRPARRRRARSLAELGIAGPAARSASPRGRTAMPAARPSSCPAASRSCCSRATRSSISSSGCATRRTASPSARTGPGGGSRSGRNPLDEIAGIGPTRKRALLRHFGTAKAVSAGEHRRPARRRRHLRADGPHHLRPFPRDERIGAQSRPPFLLPGRAVAGALEGSAPTISSFSPRGW